MANAWLRLWHDMPNDPKWRTISRISGQSISLVQATYIHILVSASESTERGYFTIEAEDVESAGENFTPRLLTEPYVTLSRHTALDHSFDARSKYQWANSLGYCFFTSISFR